MENKKWPVLAQILIGLGVIGALMNITNGLSQQNILQMTLGIAGLIIYWSIYRFKKWALIGFNILLPYSILSFLLANIGRIPTLNLLIAISIPVFILIYFNLAKIRELFR